MTSYTSDNTMSLNGSVVVNNHTNAQGVNDDSLSMTLKEARKLASTRPKREFLIDGLPRGPSLTLIVAPAKAGKTTWTENLLMNLVMTSDSFCGFPIPKVDKVLMISLEEFEAARTDRNINQLDGLIKQGKVITAVEDNYHVVTERFPRFLATKSQQGEAIDLITDIEPDVVVIDSLSRMYHGGIESSDKAKEVMQPLKNLADTLGIPLIIIHHTTKLNGKELTMDCMAGSRILSQEVDAIIGIGKTSSGMRYVKPLAYRYADDTVEEVHGFTIDENSLIQYEGKYLESELLEATDGRRRSDNRDLLTDYFSQATEVSSKGLKEAFVDGGHMSRSTLFDHLKKMELNGDLKKNGHGLYMWGEEE